MTRAFKPLIPAIPTFSDDGLAYSGHYKDVYHSASGALEQAQHVFLQGNGLPERWQGRDQFTIVETGFGLGNNFLATWAAWQADVQRSQNLHFVSFEAHPFSRSDLRIMLQKAPESLRVLVDQLLAQWPPLLPGIHRLEFASGAVTLTLVFGDIVQTVRQMQCYANAFYLDGFAPHLNPTMWSKELFGQLVRMAAPDATAATWCAAAPVRKNLQDAGFMVERALGLPPKRHMTCAQLRPHLGHNYLPKTTLPIVIVGGGIAGASTAYALAQRGMASVVIDPVFSQDLGGAHAGHAAVAMTPIITIDDAPRSRLSRAGILRAWQRWQPYLGSSLLPYGAFVTSTSTDNEKNHQNTVEQLGFDPDWVQYRLAPEASQRLEAHFSYGGLYFPYGLNVDPQRLLRQLLRQPLIRSLAQSVTAIVPHAKGWQLTTDQGEHFVCEHVVVANAAGATALLAPLVTDSALSDLAMDQLGGQSNVISASAFGQAPLSMVAGHGYILPLGPSQCVVGSSYGPADVGITSAAHDEIMQKVSQLLPLQQTKPMALSSWFGVRAAFKDHLPKVCQFTPGLWANIGYGSYGFSWAALAADIIATQLNAEPAVIERDLSLALSLRSS